MLATGASGVGFTVIVKEDDAVADPSLTVRVTVAAPFALAKGDTTALQLGAVPEIVILAEVTKAVLFDPLETDPEQVRELSISDIENVTVVLESSLNVCGEMPEIVGASFTAETVRVKLVLAVRAPSETVSVTELDPFIFAAGVNDTVQFGAVPAVVIFATGSSEVLLEDFDTEEEQANVVSMSLIVNVTPDFTVSSLVDWPETDDIVGASLTAVMDRLTV